VISAMVSKWTGQYGFTSHQILDEIITSCSEKSMRLRYSEEETKLDLIGMLTTQTMSSLNSGRHNLPM
ncbi:MAG: hypothetical protein AAF202_01270, partial [Pseudomonadota bacterium]